MSIIENLKWRNATKKFDTTKKVSDKELEIIKEAIQLSASSYGLQLYKVLVIQNQALREKLRQASWNQDQITDASHIFVFCHYTQVKDEHVDAYMILKATMQGLEVSGLNGYADFIKAKLAEKSLEEQANWMAKQIYLALGNLLLACAELKVDACPMEGFDAEKYNQILGLKEKGLSTSVVAAIGYRSEEDLVQFDKKVRKPATDLFEVIS